LAPRSGLVQRPINRQKLLAKIATKKQKPTVFCPCLIFCYVFIKTRHRHYKH
jgi:hypothetical protein